MDLSADLPPPLAFFETIDATWPAARRWEAAGWTRREGAGGGSRVSAATALAAPQIAEAGPLVMIRPGQAALDAALADAGYAVKDPTRVMVAEAAALPPPPPGPRTIAGEAPIALMEEIWAAGGIGPERLAVMARAAGPKVYLAGRVGDRPAGCAFVGAHRDIAMLHALEIAAPFRRSGLGRDLTLAAGLWAHDEGARWLSLLVTEANAPARALYAAMGFRDIGGYHYRIKEDAP
ncbi:GNAT family N-acetyltransferase [Pontivivens ytuae]|uniref:GNAT family N-acetyltransferase n=1 Tax=Pontivivens ytuae TaxID=2789856 RepID=A0A7S9LP96_9RHOB|nr:GNAT family N-acetyltransferase [Pontivivens ytuae]QPH52708.1 GNAT family N-acetyltransferase [Pontivivens ytuae]